MRKLCLLFAFSTLLYLAGAQTYFAPIGTKWYNSREQFSPTPPNPSYAVFTVVDTLTVQGKKCAKVQGGADCLTITGSVYIYQENNRVFFTDSPTNPFFPLYDFGADVGEKFTSFSWDLQYRAVFLVTGVETVMVGTQPFKIQHIELDSGYLSLGEEVAEFVGGSTLFPQYQGCDPVLGSLWCYNNGTFGYPLFPCGIVGTAEESIEPTVQIMPNPVDDFFEVQINSLSSTALDVQVFNPAGSILFKRNISTANSPTVLTLDARDWPSGVYFLKIGSGLSRKIIVQH